MIKRILYLLVVLCMFSVFFHPVRAQIYSSDTSPITTTGNSSGIQLIKSDASGVVLTLNVSSYSFNRQDGAGDAQKIELAGAGQTNEIGKPGMPSYSTLVGVPANAQVHLTVVTDDHLTVPGKIDIAPVPRADLANEDDTAGKFVYGQDLTTYTANEFYPNVVARIVDDSWLRDQRVVRVEFYPFQYNPSREELIKHTRIEVAVQFQGSDPVESFPKVNPANDPYDAILQDLVINYAVAQNWRGIPASEIYHPLTTGQTSLAPDSDPTFLGPRYKFVVSHDGLYRLTYAALQQAHPLVSDVVSTFHLYNQGRDVAIYIDDVDGNGHFGSSDSIYFYGEQFRGDYMAQRYAAESDNWTTLTEQLPDGSMVPWHPEFNHFMMEKYTDQNVYYLTVGGVGGPQMATIDGNPSGSSDPIPQNYRATVHAEKELIQWEYSFTSEDTWFWEFVQNYNTHIYTTTLSGIASGVYTATVRGDVTAYSYDAANTPDHHTQFTLNNETSPFDDAYWDGRSRYHFEGQVPQSDLIEGVNQLKFLNVNDAYSFPQIMFDFFEIEYTRLFKAEQNRLIFPGQNAGTWRYQVGGFTNNPITVFDITNPVQPIRVLNPAVVDVGGSYTATFKVTHPVNENYFVVGGFEAPDDISYYQPPNFASMNQGADYILITHPDFLQAAQTLADFHTSQGMSTMVINVNDLYEEFDDGIFHPLAIKNFLGYAFAHWSVLPTYVVLIGDGSWHMKNTNPSHYGSMPTYMPPNLSWVDPWIGQTDSPNLLANVVGDDILPDVLISRLPVTTNAELSVIVTKITSYEGSSIQDWQRNLLFVADDTPDQAGDFVYQSETVINDYVPTGYNPLRIYLDDYKDHNLCGTQPFPYGPTCTPVNHAITQTVSTTGTLLVNYTGHGSVQYWTSDKILDYQLENPGIPDDYTINDIASMQNGSMLPVVLSLTCYDGYWFFPIASANQPSLSELWMRTPGRGAVAVYAATGLGVELGHLIMQEGIYDAIFNHGIWDLGLATLAGKVNLYTYGVNYDLINTYVTFGDPALKILNPYNVDMTPSAREGSAYPGNSVDYSFQVTNQSTIPDTFSLDIANNNWPVTYPLSIGPLAAGATQNVNVSVQIPPDEDGGVTDTSIMTVMSDGDHSRTDSATLITHSNSIYGAQVSPSSSSQFNLPGQVVLYNLQVTNTGNRSDSYSVTFGPHQWVVSAPANIGPIARDHTFVLPVAVTIPADAADWDSDSVTVQITSQGDSGQSTSSHLSTLARTYGASITPPENSQEARQGTTVTYTLAVNNIGGYTDSFNISLDSTWPAVITPTVVGPIGPTQSHLVQVAVTIPTGLPGGAYDEAVVTATSEGDPTQTGEAILRSIGDVYGLIVRPAYAAQGSFPGSTVTYTLRITNTSNVSDSFHIILSNSQWATTLSADTIGPLAGNGGSSSVTVSVNIPSGAVVWASDKAIITFSSITIPDRIAIATLKTTATGWYILNLPLIQK